MTTTMRQMVGEVLRTRRTARGQTLRDVSGRARVSLGYISEVERGQKEASSELLAALAAALEVPLSEVLRDVANLLEVHEVSADQIGTAELVSIAPVRTDVQASAA